MQYELILGVDTGPASGAVTWLENGRYGACPMPGSEEALVEKLLPMLRAREGRAAAAVEFTTSYHRGGGMRYQNSATSSVAHGMNAATIRTIMLCAGLVPGRTLFLVEAQEWQQWFGVARRKGVPPPVKPHKKDFVTSAEYREACRDWQYSNDLRNYRNDLRCAKAQHKREIGEEAVRRIGPENLPGCVFCAGKVVKRWGYGDALAILLWLKAKLDV